MPQGRLPVVAAEARERKAVTQEAPHVPAWLLAAAAYRRNGWTNTMPLPAGEKFPPPGGFTGYDGVEVTDLDLAGWIGDARFGNLALRLPAGVIGIDVDGYGDKAGRETIARREREWGALPYTWRITSRWPDDDVSGIRLFRVPTGLAWANPGPGVESIHRAWRYAVCWPSRHPNGRVYCVIDERSGEVVADVIPVPPDELPELPAAWVDGLSMGPAVERVRGDAGELPVEWATTGTCLRVTKQLAAGMAALEDGALSESRHDVTTRVVLAIVGYGARGHGGVASALGVLHDRFVAVISETRRGAEGEWTRILHSAVGLIAAEERPGEHCHGAECEPGRIRELPDSLVALAAAAQTTLPPLDLGKDEGREGVTPEDVAEEHHGSRPTDLSWLLVGDPPKTEPPTTLSVGTGVHSVFYAGRVNGIFGDPEAAKTWITLAAIAETLARGGRAAFVDVDHNGAVDIAMKLHHLGAGDVSIADPACFRIYEPDSGNDLVLVAHELAEWAPDVVVWDSIGEVVPMLGLKSTDNDEVTAVIRRLLLPAARTGSCVIGIDHLPKNIDARQSGYAIGGSAKKRAIGGSYVMAEVVTGKQPAPGQVGEVRLTVEKDRPGELRRASKGKTVGRFVIDSTDPSGRITWTIAPVVVGSDGKELPGRTMERISRWVEDYCTDRTIPSVRAFREWIADEGFGRGTAQHALDQLVAQHYMEEVSLPRNGRGFKLIRPYRARDPKVFDPPVLDGGEDGEDGDSA